MSAELEQVRSIVVRVTHHIDRHDWRALRALYADDVETDYTSLFGGAPQRQRADDLVAGWQQALAAVSTQHLLGPIYVELRGSSAVAECHVRAWHQAKGTTGGDEWVVGGHYVFELARAGEAWAITRMKLETLQQSGNVKLLQEVQAAR